MTKFQKQMLTIAAAGALTAVTALPAMAFENEFHGTFAVKTFLSNIDGNANGSALLTKEETKTNNYTEQRTRLQYVAKASDDLKLVTHFEMNTLWGNETSGGDIDTDGNNLVVKHAYLDFNLGKSVNVKAGQQAYKDTLKGLYVDADLPMAYVTTKLGAYTLGLGYSRFNDEDTLTLGGNSYKGDIAGDLYAIDNTYAFNKDTKVGLSYYLNRDDSGAAATDTERRISTLGLSGQTKLGIVNLSGFAAMQNGYSHLLGGLKTKTTYHGWAADVLATMKLGSGTARTGFLFTSGDNNDKVGSNHGWQTLSSNAKSSMINTYNESGMMLLVRNPSMGGTSTDNYLRKPITNIALLHMGYDASITEKLYANGNVGFAWLPSSDNLYGATGNTTQNGSDFLGTELNVEVGYKLYTNLTLKAQAAYVMLGGAYKDTAVGANDPANPFTMRLGAHYSF
ncbi:MAG: hypothetical protein WBI04_02775 [Trichlorobacter sp.]